MRNSLDTPDIGEKISRRYLEALEDLAAAPFAMDGGISSAKGGAGLAILDQDGVYLALPPCGEGIPAFRNGVPGNKKCCLFEVLHPTGGDPRIEQLLHNDGTPVRQRVYNIWDTEATDDAYLIVQQDSFGQLLCEEPPGGGYVSPYVGYGYGEEVPGTSAPTTSPPNTTTTTAGPGTLACSGQCYWEWSAADSLWTLVTNTCTDPDDTTTSTSTSTSTTTADPTTTTTTTGDPTTTATTAAPTTLECLCPSEATTSTTSTTPDPSSTTTSSTTAEPGESDCQCLYPTFCGANDGDCVYTNCANGMDSNPPDCGQSTTSTTTAVPTTATPTSTTESPCTSCEWTWIWSRTGGWYWYKSSDGCPYPDCGACESPEEDGSGICETMITSCITTTSTSTTAGPTPDCSGNCQWYYFNGWSLVSNGCTYVPGYSCICPPPSVAGVNCQSLFTDCRFPRGSTPPPSTTGDPSSTTTSTTTSACDLRCMWSWDGTDEEWDNTLSPCLESCPCPEPDYDGQADCEIASTNCGFSPPPTTTTPAPCEGDCSWECVHTEQEDGTYIHSWGLVDGSECTGACPGVATCNCGVPTGDCSFESSTYLQTACECPTSSTTVEPTTSTTTPEPTTEAPTTTEAADCSGTCNWSCIREWAGIEYAYFWASAAEPGGCVGGADCTDALCECPMPSGDCTPLNYGGSGSSNCACETTAPPSTTVEPTTTTETPTCSGYDTYHNVNGTWSIQHSGCWGVCTDAGTCAAPTPSPEEVGMGDMYYSPCVCPATTTIPPSTTTTNPCQGDCMMECIAGTWALAGSGWSCPAGCNCNGQEFGGPCTSGDFIWQACSQNSTTSSPSSTSTTETPTSTTLDGTTP